MHRVRLPAAFTIVELLVVVTVIVVLLALLAPALDQAIYQAELTVCGARQKGVATAVLVYAGEHKRRYPHRELHERQGVKPNHIFNASGELDERIVLRPYLSINASLNDPFTQFVDFDRSTARTSVEVDYFLWFGFRYRESAHAGRGMYRIGDRLTFNENIGPNTGMHEFNLLLSDRDVFSVGSNFAHGSHPDREGKMYSSWRQDGDPTGLVPEGGGTGVFDLTMSRWQLDGGFRRGAVDLNFARDDGSVDRHTGIRIDPDGPRVVSEGGVEMIGVDEYNNDFAEGADGYIPRAH